MMDGIPGGQQKLDERRFRLEKAERQLLERCHRRAESVAAAVWHYDARRRLAAVRQQLEAQAANLASAAQLGCWQSAECWTAGQPAWTRFRRWRF